MTTTSLSLLERARRDPDSEAWRRLTELYTPLLASWLGRYAIQSSDADDLVQEVLFTVAKDLPVFEHVGRRGAFRAWLKGILANRLKNYWRSHRRHPQGRGDSKFLRQMQELEDPHSQLSWLWDREHDQYLLVKLLDLVSARFHETTVEAFRRVVIQGQSPDTVAQELGLSLNSVVIAKCRIVKELRHEAKGLLDI